MIGALEASTDRSAGFRRLLLIALFLTFDLILFGSFVRVADAGLGCPDWPGCYGKVSPVGAINEIREAVATSPDGPVTVFKAWVEMLHRVQPRWVCSSLRFSGSSRRHPRASVVLAGVTLVWVIVQGLFGMWTVTLKLQPAIVTAHLIGAMVLLGLLFAQLNRIDETVSTPVPARLNLLAIAVLSAIVAQIALGGWVDTNYAALACRDFPACQGSLWPDMDFATGFQLWRPLGSTRKGAAITIEALTAIHYAHRLLAYLVLGGIRPAWAGHFVDFRAYRLPEAGCSRLVRCNWSRGCRTSSERPVIAQVLHTGGAAALFGVALMIKSRISSRVMSLATAGKTARQCKHP